MDIKEFEDKYGDGKVVPIYTTLENGFHPSLVSIPGEDFDAGLGDLIKDYHQHLSEKTNRKFFFRKENRDWDLVEKKFRQALNIVRIKWTDTTLSR